MLSILFFTRKSIFIFNLVKDAIIYDNPYFYITSIVFRSIKNIYNVLDLMENLVSKDVRGKFSIKAYSYAPKQKKGFFISMVSAIVKNNFYKNHVMKNIFVIIYKTKNFIRPLFNQMFFKAKNKNVTLSKVRYKTSCVISKNLFSRSSTLLMENNMHIYVPKRFMLSRAAQNKILQQTLVHNYSTTKAVKFKPKRDVVKDLATDDSGKHIHRTKVNCQEKDCEKKKCVTICGQLKSMETQGFFTHKPIAGKYCRYISAKDANNKEDSQYYVKNNDKTKNIDATKLASYKQNDIKEDPKFNTFMQNNNDKFND